MPTFYVDSSALVKRYIAEVGTAWISSLFVPGPNQNIYIAQITGVEVIAAISRRLRIGDVTSGVARTSIDHFQLDYRGGFRVLRLSEKVVLSAMQLSERFALRGYDAIQLATASELERRMISRSAPSITFVSADDQLNLAAQSIGLIVDNPNRHP